jgi:hypothetical protein
MSLKKVLFQALLHAIYTALEVLLVYIGTNPFTDLKLSLVQLAQFVLGTAIVTFIRWVAANYKLIDFDGDGNPDYEEGEGDDD